MKSNGQWTTKQGEVCRFQGHLIIFDMEVCGSKLEERKMNHTPSPTFNYPSPRPASLSSSYAQH